MPIFPPQMQQFPPMMPIGRPMMMPFNNNMRPQQMMMPPHPEPRNMDKSTRQDYYGEKLFTKISTNPAFTNYASYFSKIVGIFLDLEDNIIEKLLENDKYFQEQVEETIHLLTEKGKSG